MNLIQEEVQANWNRLVQQLVSFIFQGTFFKDLVSWQTFIVLV